MVLHALPIAWDLNPKLPTLHGSMLTIHDITMTTFGLLAFKAIFHNDWFYIFVSNIGMGHSHVLPCCNVVFLLKNYLVQNLSIGNLEQVKVLWLIVLAFNPF